MSKFNLSHHLPRLLNNLRPLSLFNSLLLFGIFILFLLLLFWSMTKWVYIKDRGNGIYLNKNGLTLITAPSDGSVISFNVLQGQKVEKGELLIELVNGEERIKAETLKLRIQNLSNEYGLLKNQIEIENKARKEAVKREIETYQNLMKQNEQELKSYTYSLDMRKRFFDQGLINYGLVQQVEMDLVQTEIENESLKEKISTLSVDLNKSYRTSELKTISTEITQLEYQLSLINEDTHVYSKNDGKIISILKNPGVGIKEGDPLLIVEPEPTTPYENVVYGYFSIESGQNIEEGTPVEIRFSHISTNEYGSVLGVIESISEYAVSADHLMNIFHNKELIQLLLGNYSAVIEVMVRPLRNPNNPEEFIWTSKKTPSIPINTGTFCTLYAIIEEVKPIYYVFPEDHLKRSSKIEEIIANDG